MRLFRSIALVPVAVSPAEGHEVVGPPCIRPGQGSMLADAYGALPTCRTKRTRAPSLVICPNNNATRFPCLSAWCYSRQHPFYRPPSTSCPAARPHPVSPNGTCSRPWALCLTSRSSRPSRASPNTCCPPSYYNAKTFDPAVDPGPGLSLCYAHREQPAHRRHEASLACVLRLCVSQRAALGGPRCLENTR